MGAALVLESVMGKKKPPGSAGGEEKGNAKFSKPIKLRPVFKHRLERVADDFGVVPGQLVETKLEQFIDQEYYRIVEAEMAEIDRQRGKK